MDTRTDGKSRAAQQDQRSSRTQQAPCLPLQLSCPCPALCSVEPGWGHGVGNRAQTPDSRLSALEPVSQAPGAPGGCTGPCGSLMCLRAGGGLRASIRVTTAPRPPAVAEPRLRSAPLGSAGAGGVAVCRQDFVGDPAALPLVRPFLGPQVRGVLVFAGLFRCFPQAS